MAGLRITGAEKAHALGIFRPGPGSSEGMARNNRLGASVVDGAGTHPRTAACDGPRSPVDEGGQTRWAEWRIVPGTGTGYLRDLK